MRRGRVLLGALLGTLACVDPPRQDLRDRWAMGEGDPPAGVEAGDVRPIFRLEPGEPVQILHIEVQGLGSGWVQIHQEPSSLDGMLGLAPKALHVAPFERPVFDVQAPAALRATVRIEALDVEPMPSALATRLTRIARSEPVALRGEGASVALVARPADPGDSPGPARGPGAPPTPPHSAPAAPRPDSP